MVPATGSALYYAEDTLGSSRVIVQSNGTLCYDADFTPFGGERSITSTCAQNYKFEGKERDTETQNDEFGARYYSWRVGRWLSSDWSAVPVPVPYANLTNPQTLNLYSMVADDPESFADLDGHGPPLPAPSGGLNMDGTAQQCSGFWSCLENSVVSDNVAGIGRQDPTDGSGTAGAAVGDFVATVQGAVEVVAGGTAQAGGVAACGTGIGCLVTAPAVVAGTAAEVHGGATAAEGFGHLFSAALKSVEGGSKADKIVDAIDKGGFQVKANPKSAGQEGNVTITHPNEPGKKLNLRIETHSLEPGGKPVRHANVQRVAPGPKNRPEVVSNKHITE